MKSKKNPEKVYDIEEFRKKKKREKRIKRFIRWGVVLLILAVIGTGIYFYMEYGFGMLSREPANSALPDAQTDMESGSFPLSLDAANPLQLENFGSRMILLTTDEAAVIDTSGSISSHYVHGYTNPVLKAGDKRYLLYDRGGHGYRVGNQQGVLIDGRSTQTIQTGASGHNNLFALVTEESRYAGSVTVYDKNGNTLFSWYTPDEQITDLCFSPDDKVLAVATIYFDDEGILNAGVHLLDVKQEQEVSSADFSDAIPVAVNVLSDNSVHLVTDSFVGVISDDFTEKTKLPYTQHLRQYAFSHNYTLLVTSNANEVSSVVSLVSENGEQMDLNVRSSITSLSISDQNFCILASGHATLYDLELQPIKSEQLSDDVFDIVNIVESIYSLSPNFLTCSEKENISSSESSAVAESFEEGESD